MSTTTTPHPSPATVIPITTNTAKCSKLLAQYGLGTRDGATIEMAEEAVASSGKFSSDRTITEYATEIWKVEPCPVS